MANENGINLHNFCSCWPATRRWPDVSGNVHSAQNRKPAESLRIKLRGGCYIGYGAAGCSVLAASGSYYGGDDMIYVWPVGYAKLVRCMREVPRPCEFYGAWDGYRFFKFSGGIYAIPE